MAFLANIRLAFLLLTMFMVGKSIALSKLPCGWTRPETRLLTHPDVDVFEELHDMDAHVVHGGKGYLSETNIGPSQADLVDTVNHLPGLATLHFAHDARGKSFLPSEGCVSSSAYSDIDTAVHDGAEVTEVTFTVGDGKPTETSEVSSTPTEVTHVTFSINPTGTSEVVTTQTETETEPCGPEEPTTIVVIPSSTALASTPATKTETETETVSCSTPCSASDTRITFSINPTSIAIPASTETETKTKTVSCSSASPCHTKATTSTRFGFTISLTNTATNTKATTPVGVPVTITFSTHPHESTGTTLVTQSSSKTTVEGTTVGTATSTLKTGTAAFGTSTATIVFNGAQKLEGFNKLTATGLFLLVCKLLL